MVDIVIFGHSKGAGRFENESALLTYMKRDLFRENQHRYRYTISRNVDIILISYGGKLMGHFKVQNIVDPDIRDKNDFPPVKKTYIIEKAYVYSTPPLLLDFGIKNIQFGKSITEDQFEAITTRAGSIEEFS